MKCKLFFIAITGIAFLSSCKSLSKITSKDGSTAKTTAKSNTTSGDPQFINNIEVNPGTVVTSKHKTTGIKKETVNYKNPDPKAPPSNIESTDYLQLKYAVLMDVTVEKLNNHLLLEKIEEWWGTRYCMGGSTKSCIDCSAFSSTLLKDVYGITVRRTAEEQYKDCDKIETDELKEGDLVFFHTKGKAISHVGVYVANNKFVHASTSGGVTITDLDDKYWHSKYKGAGRAKGMN
ncbi:C40 family peptidase [Chitinophagaceae bacterium LWZ2-11]